MTAPSHRELRCRSSSTSTVGGRRARPLPVRKSRRVPTLSRLTFLAHALVLLIVKEASALAVPPRSSRNSAHIDRVVGGASNDDGILRAADADDRLNHPRSGGHLDRFARSEMVEGSESAPSSAGRDRRSVLRGWAAASGAAAAAVLLSPPSRDGCVPIAAASAAEDKKSSSSSAADGGGGGGGGGGGESFRSGAYGREEYTNSIVASRDTNISPREVYDSIESRYVRYPLEKLREAGNVGRAPRALDVGAGAGVSTQVLWDVGYRSIDAVDWSGSAWERFVVDDPEGRCPPGVTFFELDDERYLDVWQSEGREKFDVIVFNFAVNEDKARLFAKYLLRPENGRLLAPVNAQRDYWLKQTYKAFDASGAVLWSATDVGAWSVQFQPDVTQDTCQGIWCSPYNGFKKKR